MMPRMKSKRYEIDDLVWLETDVGHLKIEQKIRLPDESPYTFFKKLGALDYELQLFLRKTKVVQINRSYFSL